MMDKNSLFRIALATFLISMLLIFKQAKAEDHVDIRLNDVQLTEFAYVVLNDMLKTSFVLDDDFMVLSRNVTIRLSDVPATAVLEHLRRLLDRSTSSRSTSPSSATLIRTAAPEPLFAWYWAWPGNCIS
jgi:hypothetical protein